jgi:hypothetical protein
MLDFFMASLLFNIFDLVCQYGHLYFISLDPQRLDCESSALTFKSLLLTFSIAVDIFWYVYVPTQKQRQKNHKKLLPTNNRKLNLRPNKVQC